jgi:hypothetical protein
MKMIRFFVFPCNGAPVEWSWQGKIEVLGEKPVPVPLWPPQIRHGLSWDRTQASAVRGRRLIAWAMARPTQLLLENLLTCHLSTHLLLFFYPNKHCLLIYLLSIYYLLLSTYISIMYPRTYLLGLYLLKISIMCLSTHLACNYLSVRKFQKNKVTETFNQRTLFWFRWTYGASVADGTHQNSK